MKICRISIFIEIRKMKQYIINFFTSLMYVPISLLIYYFLYRSLLESGVKLAADVSELMAYYTVVLFIRAAVSHAMRAVYDVFTDINDGDLDLWIVCPVSYPFVRFFRAMGSVIVTVPTGILLLVAAMCFWSQPDPVGVLLLLVSTFLGFTVLYAMMFLLGLLTFWIKTVLTIRDIFWGILSIFSGELIPLQLLPEKLRFFAWNPLASVYYMPARVLEGEWGYLWVQLAYVVLLGGAALLVWRVGLRKYESQGG